MAEDKTQIITRTRSWLYTFRTIFARELKVYLGTPFGWVILACATGLQGFWLQAVLQTMSKASGESVMYYMLDNVNFWFFFIFIFPLITMRCMAEEESHGTLEGLLTAPVTTTQVILGKYLASLIFYIILWMPMLLYPWISDLGNLYTSLRYDIQPEGNIVYTPADWYGPISILTISGSFFIALGIFCSSLTRSQIIAGIICTCSIILYYFIGRVPELWGEFPAAPAFHYLSISEQISAFSRGLVDTRPLVLYASLTIFTLALTKRIVDYRRWHR